MLLLAGGAMVLMSRGGGSKTDGLVLKGILLDPKPTAQMLMVNADAINPKPSRVPPPPVMTPVLKNMPLSSIYGGAINKGLKGNPGKGNWGSVRGHWLDLNSSGLMSELESMHKIWGNPPSLDVNMFIGMIEADQVLAWIAVAPEQWQWGYGNAKDRSARVDKVTRMIGKGSGDPEAIAKDIGNIAGGIAQASLAVAGTATGLSSPASLGNSIVAMVDALASAIGGGLARAKKRKMLANAVLSPISQRYMNELAVWNPHIVHNGKINLSPGYKANPQTIEDLSAGGNSRPIVYLPAYRDLNTPIGR
jgi:hypothetical protein